jgi:tetratricopeptide (TPR) repeat protein
MIRRSSLAVLAAVAVAALAVAAGAAVAGAAPPAKFTAEYQAGVDAFRLGKFDDARAHLEKARALAPKLPGPHRFLAATAQAQERWDDCIASARRALELNPASAEVAETRKLHDACRASSGRPAYRGPALGEGAAVAVTANIDGATVKIGGLVYGGTPLEPRPITAGAHVLEVSKLGYKPATVSVDALPGIVTDVAVELEPR